MNICFLIGKIVSNVEFKFIVNNKKYYSIVIFKIELANKSKVTIKGYNEIADYCYRNIEISNYCVIEGKINTKMEIIIKNIIKKEEE